MVHPGDPNFILFVIFRVNFGYPVSYENLIFYKENSTFWGSFWAPKRDHFFVFFCILQETYVCNDDAALDLRFTVISKTSVLPRQN